MDTTGRILAERVLRAADRGVRVRLLIDDINTVDTDFGFAKMDRHPNIEIRIFNPFANRNVRGVDFVFDFSRVNHRMHNKVFVATTSPPPTPVTPRTAVLIFICLKSCCLSNSYLYQFPRGQNRSNRAITATT